MLMTVTKKPFTDKINELLGDRPLQAVADRVTFTYTHCMRIFKDGKIPSPAAVKELADFFNTDYDELQFLADYQKSPESIKHKIHQLEHTKSSPSNKRCEKEKGTNLDEAKKMLENNCSNDDASRFRFIKISNKHPNEGDPCLAILPDGTEHYGIFRRGEKGEAHILPIFGHGKPIITIIEGQARLYLMEGLVKF